MADTSDEILPALSPTEWATMLTGQGWMDLPNAAGTAQLKDDGKVSLFPNGEAVWLSEPEQKATVAALCLHDQTFGFTREDVDRLISIAELLDTPSVTSTEESWFIASLAARIAALLPPSP